MILFSSDNKSYHLPLLFNYLTSERKEITLESEYSDLFSISIVAQLEDSRNSSQIIQLLSKLYDEKESFDSIDEDFIQNIIPYQSNTSRYI